MMTRKNNNTAARWRGDFGKVLLAGFLLGGFLLPPGLGADAPAKPVPGAPSVSGPAKEKTPEPARLSYEQRQQIQKLVGMYRLARGDKEKKKEAVRQAIQHSPAAAAAMLEAISRELSPQIERYRNQFFKQAQGMATKQVAKADLQEIQALRQKVLSLSKRPDFSKELIEREADPAMKRLEEIFVLDRQKVLEAFPNLQKERERLRELGELWEQCATVVWESTPPEAEKPAQKPSFDQYLEGEEALAAGLAAPMDPKNREILAMNSRLASQLDPEEARAVLALNLTRNLLGLSAVLIDLKLCEAARDHSQDMQKHNFFAHESPVPGKKTPWDRAKRFGTTASAENIAAGYQDGRAVNLGWFHSPGHHRNMLGNHRRVGMGRAGGYFTEM
ncbi:MAG TPA: CAP domain-containing protein, partial [Thermoguttaceae bacterium]|nr:CAP domain-containing protein [Thermoguttaceae bacterium]